jgi:hypothetical protein
MNPESYELERLISRYLDDEATPAERRQLLALERFNPQVAALIEEYASLDAEVGRALRRAMERPLLLRVHRTRWARIGQAAALAAAACVAMLVWLIPSRGTAPVNPHAPERAAVPWFDGSPNLPGDTVQGVNRWDVRPQVRLRNTDRDWLIVPGQRPGEFMVIEVNRVRTRAIAIQNDF